ncbi:DNA/RNA non-specific endonuclease [Wenyingzhuangia sp. IMCC45533]
MKKSLLFTLLLFFLIVLGVFLLKESKSQNSVEVENTTPETYNQTYTIPETTENTSEEEQQIGDNKSLSFSYNYNLLKPSKKDIVYDKTYYSIDYNEEHEQPNWVYYLLTSEFVNGSAKRKDRFKADNEITTKSATLSDYKKSGYDRGHLCPAADMKINDLAMRETFLLSNMSPQLPSLNRGEWKRLEAKIRDWAVEEDSIIVVTGPIFKNNLGKIGKSKVTIPGAYYKVIYDITKPQKMTAFILPHIKELESFANYQTSVNEVEQQTGIDFFSMLDDATEEVLESNNLW